MNEDSKPRRKKLQKIGFEELMGAAGMSGFGALLEASPAKPGTASRVRLSLRASALAEALVRQNDALRSLNKPLTERINSLERVLGMLKQMNYGYRRNSAPVRALHAQPGGEGASLNLGL